MKLTIIGASGHGKVVAEIAELCGYDEIEFLDDNTSLASCGNWPVIGTAERAGEVESDIFIAIGNADTRNGLWMSWRRKESLCLSIPLQALVVIEIGRGSVVMAGAVINPGARIGEGCIVNTSSPVDHDCVIGDYVHISVGAHISGTVDVGDDVWIGAGATVVNTLTICGNCIIGAGAVVIKDVKESGTYIGVPAKKMDKKLTIRRGYCSSKIITVSLPLSSQLKGRAA